MAKRSRAWDVASAAVLLAALLACSTRVDQVVYRYRLQLNSPTTDGAAACWDYCMSEAKMAKGGCLKACPGVEVTSKAGCQVDGRLPVQELCHTEVAERKKLDSEGTFEALRAMEAAADVAQAATEAAMITSEIANGHSSHASDFSPATVSGESQAGPSRVERRERTPATATPQPAVHERPARHDAAGRLGPRGPLVGP